LCVRQDRGAGRGKPGDGLLMPLLRNEAIASRSRNVGLGESDSAWLAAFAARHGRKLRVLHVGNIANNAFINAKFQRRAGIEAEVLCYDYYHVMGTPEWEEVDLRHPYGDDYHPSFAPEDVAGYTRPTWFIQGPLPECHRRICADGDRAGRAHLPRQRTGFLVDCRDRVYRLLNFAIRD